MQSHLNAINVFPVPDGDTGTNMSQTMDSIASGVQACETPSIEDVSSTVAESALTGARGNSGAILAQFFQGLAEATRGKARLTTKSFAQAVSRAVEQAKHAMTSPREGTILTVMREWSTHLSDRAHHHEDFSHLLKDSLGRARTSLDETPSKLKELRTAGVVDAGAAGFVHILEGVVQFMETGKINAVMATAKTSSRIRRIKQRTRLSYRYCTECLIQDVTESPEDLRKDLSVLGDSLIVVRGIHKIKIHIHTNQPKHVFEVASRYGTVIRKKMDDMSSQQQHSVDEPTQHITLVTDSTCDLPDDLYARYDIKMIPVLLRVGNKTYRDRVELKPEAFYRLLKSGEKDLSTSQPTPRSFADVYEIYGPESAAILSIHLSGAISGTLNAARVSANTSPYRSKIHCIDSKTTSAALGLVVLTAAKCIEQNLPLDTIQNQIQQTIDQVRLFVSIPDLKHLIKSGRLTRSKGFIARLLNIKPIITFDSTGHVVQADKVIGRNQLFEKTLSRAIGYGQSITSPIFSIVHVLSPDLAEAYRKRLQRAFHQDRIMIMDASPGLGVHTGIGSVAIAVTGTLQA